MSKINNKTYLSRNHEQYVILNNRQLMEADPLDLSKRLDKHY